MTVIGSDIDTNVLAAARRGNFSDRSVQNLSPEQLARYFEPMRGGGYRLRDDLRGTVDFAKVNLLATPPRFRAQDIDVVFCRNLLIYFDQQAQRHAVENIAEALRPGGFVLLGHSESMSRISSLFAVRRLTNCIVYQKPEDA